MKQFLTLIAFIFVCSQAHAQQYIPMPADSASWRYRVIELDDTNYLVIDVLLVVTGRDTVFNGTAYHTIFARTHAQTVGASSYPPPVVDDTCLYPDAYFSAMRESGKKIYEWTGATDKLMYDFNALAGSQVPAPGGGTATITSIDSVLLGGVWHKRYHTGNASYYIIEGVGSSIGLLPSYYGPGWVSFHCFSNPQFKFSPAGAPNCTTIHPAIGTGVKPNAQEPITKAYPTPFANELHIESSEKVTGTLYSITGRQVLPAITFTGHSTMYTNALPPGVYCLILRNSHGATLKVEKLVKR